MAKRRRRKSTKLIELKNKARRAGWLKWIRKGPGEEADERAMLGGCWFDIKRGQHFISYVDKFATLTEGAWSGQPFTLRQWQHDASMRVFGWLRPSAEWGYPVRRFRYWYEEVPKKNGKTPFVATIGNYLMFADAGGRQINTYLAATTRKQAQRCLVHAIRQIKNNIDLRKAARIKKLEGFFSVEYGNNEWHVLAADPDSADGVNGHCLADELHRWKGTEFYNTLVWSIAAQPEGLFVGITTAGSDMQSVCRMLHDKTIAINNGRQHDEAFFGEIFAADADDDPHDEKTWLKANPSLGTNRAAPLKLSTFRSDYRAAKQDPSQWPMWLQLRLNIWRSGSESWIDEIGGIEAWDAGAAARKSSRRKRIDCYEEFIAEDLEGCECFVGFDGATHHDTTAAVFAFADPKTDELVRVLPYFWMPEAEAIKQQARVPYRNWAEQGLITLTPGDAVDFRTVFNDLVELFGRFRVLRYHFDPLFQAEWLTQELTAATGVERVEFPQRITQFTQPMKAMERLIVLRKLRHNGHQVLTWQLGNTQSYTDCNNNKRPRKRTKADYRTVDGVVSLIMALRDAIAVEEADYYEDHDVEFI